MSFQYVSKKSCQLDLILPVFEALNQKLRASESIHSSALPFNK